jgi:ubiquinone/menaquinone biosynthesis C-methylase UbiE
MMRKDADAWMADASRNSRAVGGSVEGILGSVREPRELMLGDSTARGGVVAYRIAKIASVGPIEGRWLDCGCAEGSYARALMEAGAHEVVGIDLDEAAVARAQSTWTEIQSLRFEVGSAEQLPFAGRSFEGVLMNEVLEHVVSQRQTLAEIRRVLVPGGRLIVFSPNRWFPFEGHGAVIGPVRLCFPVPLLPWLPQRITWRAMTARNFWPRQLVQTIRAGGFEIQHVGFAFPLFVRYKWLPAALVRLYLKILPSLEQHPVLRRFGVSTFVVAAKRSSE